MNKTAKTLLLGSLLVASALMLQGCGGCDTTKMTKCLVKEVGFECDNWKKYIKCIDGCCGEKGAKTLSKATADSAKLLDCTVTDPCA